MMRSDAINPSSNYTDEDMICTVAAGGTAKAAIAAKETINDHHDTLFQNTEGRTWSLGIHRRAPGEVIVFTRSFEGNSTLRHHKAIERPPPRLGLTCSARRGGGLSSLKIHKLIPLLASSLVSIRMSTSDKRDSRLSESNGTVE